ncbi:serine hydrolase [Nocardia sp. NPDC046763]|uniref:serine hydrolase n=1 Tax=Nocardia sp. NPDC046763 TaxID=3155256 RepID=UPI0033E2872C
MIEQTGAGAPTLTAAEQLDWLVAASARVPLPEQEIQQRVAPSLLTASGGPAGFNAAAGAVGPLTVTRAAVAASRPDQAQAAVHGGGLDYLLTVRVDQAGRVGHLELTLDEAPPACWAEADSRLAALGGRVSFAAATIAPDRTCRIEHGLDPDALRPIGSGFKLYVLGALGQAVAEGRASWGERLAIHEDWKSLPSGTLQDRPAGDALTLAEYADPMMSISDNTATDHLIHRLGRDTVARQLSLFGHQEPRANEPFLTTRAFFQLKYSPDHVRRYLSIPPAERAMLVEHLESMPLPDTSQPWTQPREIDQIEWFASPVDICHAYAGLLRLNQPEIGHALSLDPGGLGLDAAQFPTVWYKPGSEPGVVTLNYLARTADGRAMTASLMVSDPTTPPSNMDVLTKGRLIIRGAFQLLAQPH